MTPPTHRPHPPPPPPPPPPLPQATGRLGRASRAQSWLDSIGVDWQALMATTNKTLDPVKLAARRAAVAKVWRSAWRSCAALRVRQEKRRFKRLQQRLLRRYAKKIKHGPRDAFFHKPGPPVHVYLGDWEFHG